MHRIVTTCEERVSVKLQLFIRCFVSPSLLIAIFDHKHNRINHKCKMKIHTKNAKINDSSERLSNTLTFSNESITRQETEHNTYHMCPMISYELCGVINPKVDCRHVLHNKRNRQIAHGLNNNKLSFAPVDYLGKDTCRYEEGQRVKHPNKNFDTTRR